MTKISEFTELTTISGTDDYWIYFQSEDGLSDYRVAKSTIFGNELFGVDTAITAYAGGGQANATELTKKFNNITTVASSGDSVKLPDAIPGRECYVTNTGAESTDIYPQSGETIGTGNPANTPYSLSSGYSFQFVCLSNGLWVGGAPLG